MSDRKVVLKMVLSLDGFATSPDGTHEWMFEWFDDDSGERSLQALQEAGVAHEAAVAARPKRQSPGALGVVARSPSSTVG